MRKLKFYTFYKFGGNTEKLAVVVATSAKLCCILRNVNPLEK